MARAWCRRCQFDQCGQWSMVWIVLVISRAKSRRISLSVNGISVWSVWRSRSRAAMTVKMAWASMTSVMCRFQESGGGPGARPGRCVCWSGSRSPRSSGCRPPGPGPATGSLTWLFNDHQATAQLTVNAASQQATNRRQTPYGQPRGDQPPWPNARGFVGGANRVLVDGTRWTKAGTGRSAAYYRYFDDGNGNWHWSGSTNGVNSRGVQVSIPLDQVPISVRRS